MQLCLKPYVTNGVVIVGAAALVAAPIAISPPDIGQPTPVAERSIAVEPKALINDLLNAFAAVTDATGETIANALFFVGVEPNFVARWVQALAQNPELAASIASAVVTLELLDLVDIPSPLINTIAGLLPPQLGQSISQAYAGLFNFIDPGRLGGLLPDPTDGINAINAALLPPLVDNLTNGFLQAVDSVGVSMWGALIFLGQTPNTLLSVAQSAVTNPADIPGLASFLAYSLINPFSNPVLIDSVYSLAIEPLIDGVINIAPPPLGGAAGLVATVKNSLDSALTAILDALPAPVFPSPFVSPLIAPNVVSTEVVSPAGSSQVANFQIADFQIVDAEIVEGSGEERQTTTAEDPADLQASGNVDAGLSTNLGLPQQDTPQAEGVGQLDDKHVRLNVKKVNPVAGDLDDSQPGTTTTTEGSTDENASGAPGVGEPVERSSSDPDPGDASDNDAGGVTADEHADADQGGE